MIAVSDDARSRSAPARSSTSPTLTAYLERELGAHGAVTVEQFPGGHSNLTYLVRHGDREYVLRRPPFGSKVKSAHDMGREVRVLSKLAPVYARAPRVLAYERRADVLGAPFYLMERRRGVILRKRAARRARLDRARVRRLCELLVDTLVDLHAVDYTRRRPRRLRQARRLRRAPGHRLDQALRGVADRRHPGDDRGRRVARRAPARRRRAGADPQRLQVRQRDLRSRRSTRITGVLDWEMATIGDPLMDLGTSLSYWAQADDPPAFHAAAVRRRRRRPA